MESQVGVGVLVGSEAAEAISRVQVVHHVAASQQFIDLRPVHSSIPCCAQLPMPNAHTALYLGSVALRR